MTTEEEPKRFVVIASDENPLYSFFLPLTGELWKRNGFHPYYILVSQYEFTSNPRDLLIAEHIYKIGGRVKFINPIPGFQTSNTAQVSRLLCGLLNVNEDAKLMTIDADIWPLTKAWYEPAETNFKLWNFQGCDGFFMCYACGSPQQWRDLMGIAKSGNPRELYTTLETLLVQRLGRDRESWGLDEVLLNEHLAKAPFVKEVVKRPIDPITSLPVGRVDRAGWTFNGDLTGKIDAHLIRPGYDPEIWKRLKVMINALGGIDWAESYWSRFIELIKH